MKPYTWVLLFGLGSWLLSGFLFKPPNYAGATLLVVCGVVGLAMYFTSENFRSRLRRKEFGKDRRV
jgi:hypothetical protein